MAQKIVMLERICCQEEDVQGDADEGNSPPDTTFSPAEHAER